MPAMGIVFSGFLMGSADVVPGVSGGTVALILGIYNRLLGAISHFDRTLIRYVRQRQWSSAAGHIDLGFLSLLALGLIGGFGVMTVAMNVMLAQPFTRALTWSAFFGLIAASSILVGKLIRVRNPQEWFQAIVCGLLGAGFSWWLTTLGNATVEPSLPYIFCCGLVAICAMILPGISGAMILLVLGVYIHLTEIPKEMLHGDNIPRGLLTIAVFGAGCLVGLLSFSKILKWLLSRHHRITMATLCGFMVGALAKLWPFQRDLTPEIQKIKYKQFEAYWPAPLDASVLAIVLVAVTAFLFVMIVDAIARRRAKRHST